MRPKIDWLGGRLTLQMIPHLMFRTFLLCVFFNAVSRHLNLCSCMSGATVCRFTIQLAAAWRWSTNLQPADGELIKTSADVPSSWNENLHALSYDGTWLREVLDSILKSAHIDASIFIFHIAGRDVALWASLKEHQDLFVRHCFVFCLLIFFFLLFCPSISQILEDALSCLSIHYIKYIY